MTLEWSEFAISDRGEIFDYIDADSPQAAADLDCRIEEAIESLRRFPEMGRPGRVDGTRELVILGTPYIAAYRVRRNVIRVLRVLHGSRLWPNEIT